MKSKTNIIYFLILGVFSVIIGLSQLGKEKVLIVACDVGQGDAILVQQGKSQILIDGGAGNLVLECLGKYMPFWDREVEVVILTHPDYDHFGGLIEVFRRYKVGSFLKTQAQSSTSEYKVLESEVGGGGTPVEYVSGGMTYRLGLMQIDILNPMEDKTLLENGGKSTDSYPEDNLNDTSVVCLVSFGEFDALLTGDIGIEAINKLLSFGVIKDVEYIKIPHHGSDKNVSSGLLLYSKPEVAVISVGEKNRYGHPGQDTLKLLDALDIETKRTDVDGDVVVETDGKSFWIR